MAPRSNIFSGFGRGNRDTENDGRPGNPEESRPYSRIFDVESATEYTNRPETATQLLVAQQALDAGARGSAAQEAQSSVQFFPSVGKFIIPKENTWAAHAELVKDPAQKLGFNPEKYAYFDKLVADAFPAIMNPKYEGLRTNIAVMRNDIIGMYLNDGSFDPGDEKYIPYIGGVARGIGQLLANDSFPKRIFAQHVDVNVANVEGVGAREIYKHLLDIQVAPGKLNDLKVLLGNYDRSWGLPPIEATPYSEINLSAPPPRKITCEPCDQSRKFTDAYLNERDASLAGPLKGW